MLRKKIYAAALPTTMLCLALMGCGGQATTEQTTEETAGTVSKESNANSDYEVVFSESAIFSQQDQQDAIDAVMAEFNTWTGCTMMKIAVESDEICEQNLTYANSIREEGTPDFDQAMVLKSDFHSPTAELAEGTAWEPDSDYLDYTWILGRTAGGAWQVLSWGYA